MKKGKVAKRIVALILAITTILTMTVTSAFAAEDSYAKIDQINVGDIIDGFSGKAEVVIEVNTDGSFKTMEITASTYAACPHYKWNQVSNAIYRGNKRVNTASVCYQKVYSAIYQCSNCKTRREITTYINVNHNYVSGKCSFCGRRK